MTDTSKSKNNSSKTSTFIEVKDDELKYYFDSLYCCALLFVATPIIEVLVCFIPITALVGV